MAYNKVYEDTFVYIDLANLEESIDKKRVVRINYQILFDYLKERFNARTIFAYNGIKSEMDNENPFYDMLRAIGYKVSLSKCHESPNGSLIQKEVDTSIVADMVDHTISHQLRNIVLISGDRDMRPAVKIAKSHNCKVTVLCYSGVLSCDLKDASDEYIDLGEEGPLGLLELRIPDSIDEVETDSTAVEVF